MSSFASSVASFEATRLATGNQNANRIEVNGEKGAIRWDFEDMNVLWYFNAADDPAEMAAPFLEPFDIYLSDDFFSWTTGDYVLYTRVEGQTLADQIAPLIDDPMGSQMDLITLDGLWDIGILIEATDPAAARSRRRRPAPGTEAAAVPTAGPPSSVPGGRRR